MLTSPDFSGDVFSFFLCGLLRNFPILPLVENAQTIREDRLKEASAALDEAAQLRVRDLNKAVERAVYACSVFKELGEVNEQVRAQVMIAWCQCDLARYEESHDSAMKALDLALEHESEIGICAGYLQLGITACQAGDLLDSVEYLETSLEQARKLNDPLLRIRALSNLAAVYGDLRDYDKATSLMNEVFMLLARNVININLNIVEGNYAGFIVQKSILAYEAGQHKQAIEFAETARMVLTPVVERMRQQGDLVVLSRSLNNVAKTSAILGDIERAKSIKRDLKRHSREIGTDHAKGLYQNLCGFLAMIEGNHKRSARCYALAAALFSRLNTKTLAHNALVDATNAYERCGDYRNAFENLRAAHRLEQAQKMHEGVRRFQALNVKLAVEKARHENEILRVKNEVLHERAQELETKAVLDGLTGCLNRIGLEENLIDTHSRVIREDLKAFVAVLDVDHFKQVNDTFGHLIGDDVLREISKIMRDSVRRTDTVGRFGGDEFLLILEQDSLDQALFVIERVHEAIRESQWDSIAPGLKVTASIGITTIVPHQPIASILQVADEYLYEAKRSGRDRIVGPYGAFSVASAA